MLLGPAPLPPLCSWLSKMQTQQCQEGHRTQQNPWGQEPPSQIKLLTDFICRCRELPSHLPPSKKGNKKNGGGHSRPEWLGVGAQLDLRRHHYPALAPTASPPDSHETFSPILAVEKRGGFSGFWLERAPYR